MRFPVAALSTPRLARAAAALALLTGLSACGSLFGGPREPPRPCPRVVVVDELARKVAFRPGGGQDLVDVVHQVEIGEGGIACTYDKTTAVTARTLITLVAERGPADATRRADVAFFVAVVDGDDRVLARQEFQVPFRFEGNLTRVRASEEIEQVIPLRGRSGSAFRVMIGLDLTRDQLEFNRSRAQR